MSDRTDLPSILTRALLAAAAPRAQRPGAGPASPALFPPAETSASDTGDLAGVSEDVHRLLSELIILILLELEGLVDSPLNIRARARIRLGAPSRSRVLVDWPASTKAAAPRDLFAQSDAAPGLPISRDPDAFFAAILRSVRSSAEALHLGTPQIEELIRWLLPVIARCAPEDDPVGWIHAHGQRHQLARGPGNRLRFQVDRERGRSHGVLYTPPPLTEALIDAVLGIWSRQSGGVSASLFGSSAGRPAETRRILDPACGSGQFLLSIARRLLNVEDQREKARPEEIIGIFRSMHGVDIDPWAATLSAFNLSLQAVRALCKSQGADPPVVMRWLQEQLGPGFPWFLGTQVHQGNALLLAATPDGTTFRWTERFASIFNDERPGFDIVIGNPPWVSYGLRNRAGAEEEESAYLRGLFTFGAQYKLSLYPLFIELALRLTRPNGLHGFLVPDSFFTGRHFSRIRAHMLETCQPLLFCLVESGPWPGVHVGHTAFYCVRRLPTPEPARAVTTCAVKFPPYSHRARRSADATLSLFAADQESNRPVLVDEGVFRSTPHHAFRVFRDDGERRFIEMLERQPKRLENLIETYSGLIARYGQESVIGPRDGPFVLRDKQGHVAYRDPDPQGRWMPALHSGAEVEAFRVRARGGAVYVPADRDMLRKVYKSGFDLGRYRGEKVLLRQTGDNLIAARDKVGLLCLNNVHILTSNEDPGVDPRFLCGLLMSDPIQRYYQIVALEAGRPLAQVDLVTIEALPYPCDRSGMPFGERSSTDGRVQGTSRDLKRLEAAMRSGSADEIVDLSRRAYDAGPDRLAGEEGFSGRDLATVIVCRIVELLESSEEERLRKALREALDGVFGALFGIGAGS